MKNKRLVSLLAAAALILTMFAIFAIPNAMGAEIFTSIYEEHPVSGIWETGDYAADAEPDGRATFRSAKKITVAAGDKIYFGPCTSTQSYQLYFWEGQKNGSQVHSGSSALAIADIFEGGQVLYCYTASAAGTIGIVCHKTFIDCFVVTRNEEVTAENFFEYWQQQGGGGNYATLLGTAPAITSNAFTADATQGYYNADGTIYESTAHYSGTPITVKAGDIIYYGPANAGQNFQLYHWDSAGTATKVTKAMVTAGNRIHTVDTFPNGQVILAYEVTKAGTVGLVNATAYNPYFLATKNVRMTAENYYHFYDLTDNRSLTYSADLGRYNTYETETSVLNGKSALFVGDSICIGHGDDEYYNDQDLGGWSGRIKQFYDLDRAVNNGVSGTSLSTARDLYNTTTSDKQGRIYWQIVKEQKYQYDYVILHGGVNDAWETYPVGEMTDSFNLEDFNTDTYAGALEELFYYATTLHKESAIGYIMNFHAPNCKNGIVRDMAAYFAEGKKICEKWEIPYLDLYNTFEFDTTVYTYDNIHPNAAGYDLLYIPIAEWMETLAPYGTHTVTEHDKTVIACVGDSLTKGEKSGDVNRYSYPAYLQEMLGSDYEILNLGWGGAAAQTTASNTYTETTQYRSSLDSDPNIVIVMLGANDAKSANWDSTDHTASCAAFKAELKKLVQTYQNLPSKPTVYLATPPYSSVELRETIYTTGGMNAAIEAIATELGVKFIDAYTPTTAQSALLTDGTHYTAAGYEFIAGEMYKALTGEQTAPDVLAVTEKETAVSETDETKPLIRNWKEYYETATAFRIETVEDVEIFGDLIAAGYTFAGKTVYLEKDLDFAGINFKPLGASTGVSGTPADADYANAFQGIFDGQNHIFSNVNINSGYYKSALFPVLKGATIQNFGMDGGQVIGYDVVASIAGYAMYGTKIHNVWSSADVYAITHLNETGAAGIAACTNDAETAAELVNVAYYGHLKGVTYLGGIAVNAGSSTLAEGIVFGGTMELLYQPSKKNYATPFVRYNATVTGQGGNYFAADDVPIRGVYTTDVTPTLLPREDFTSGEFAYAINKLEGNTTKWIMSHGYAVPWGDENTAIHKVTVDGKVHYTNPDGKLPDELLDKGAFWYKDGICYTAEDAKTWVYTDDTTELTIGISASSNGADYDGDGIVKMRDVLLLIKAIDGLDIGIAAEAADTNADGKVTIFDAVKLLQVLIDLNT